MQQLPWFVPGLFLLTVVLGIFLFARAAHFNRVVILVVVLIAILQSILGLNGFYSESATMTARFPLLVAPLLIFVVLLFVLPRGKRFIDSLDLGKLTILHTIRVLVELVLFWLFLHQAIPRAMTFEGRNFDIFSGITAPFAWYFGFVRKTLPRAVLIAWNVVCMLLLLNVVANALLSLPARFEIFHFERPNIAVGHFPFLLLPAILVPLVLFANAAAIRQLLLNKD